MAKQKFVIGGTDYLRNAVAGELDRRTPMVPEGAGYPLTEIEQVPIKEQAQG